MKNPLVSVIMVTMQNKKWLEKSLQALQKQQYKQIEIIVIDNAAEKSIKEFLQKRFPTVIYLFNSINVGFGKAANIGIRASKGKYVLIYNDDAICDQGFIKLLVFEMEKDKTLGACQGVLLKYDNPDIVESIGSYMTKTGILWKDSGFKYSLRQLKTQYVFNANLPLIRKKVLDKIGLFDEDYFLYFEEADLCWRIWEAGYKIVVIPGAKIWHKSGMTTKKLNHTLVIQSTYQNRLNSLIKNLEMKNMLHVLPMHVLFLIISFLTFIVLGKFGIALGVIKSIFINIFLLPKTLRKRFLIQRDRKINDAEIFKYGMKSMTVKYLLSTSSHYFLDW